MRTPILSLVVWGLWAAVAPAQTVSMPAEMKVKPNRIARVQITHDGTDLKWSSDPNVDVIREFDPDPKLVKLAVFARLPERQSGCQCGGSCKCGGRGSEVSYYVFATAVKDGKMSEVARCKIVVVTDGAAPPPPPPTVAVEGKSP